MPIATPMAPKPSDDRVLLSHVAPELYAPMTRLLLAKLGYLILSPEELASIEGADALRPVLLLLDERQVSDLPAADHAVPILMVTPQDVDGDARVDDVRVAGVVQCPVQSQELFRMIQQLTERTPRSTPRVECKLAARCRQHDRSWSAELLMISENGALLAGGEMPKPGTRLRVAFELPESGRLQFDADVAYPDPRGVGLVFSSHTDTDRRAIARFVEQTLLD